jgi:WD40 repeat protein
MVSSLVFSGDSKTLASASEDNTIRLWDPAAGRLRHILEGHGHPVSAVAMAPDGKLLASAAGANGPRGELYLWDTASGRRAAKLRDSGAGLFDVAFSPDGKRIASGGADGTLRVHDVEDSSEVLTIPGIESPFIRRVGFADEGRTLFACGNFLRFFDARTGLRTVSIALAETTDLKVDPTNAVFAAAAYKTGEIYLQDRSDSELGSPWGGHRQHLHTLAFSPDGRFLASTSSDGSARLWDVVGTSDGKLRAVLLGHTGGVYGVAFSPDGRTLATGGSEDWTIRLWDVSALAIRTSP